MPHGLTRGLGTDQGETREPQVEKEGCDDRPGRSERDVEEPDRPPEHEEATVRVALFGVRPEQQQARRPGRKQDEDPDQAAGTARGIAWAMYRPTKPMGRIKIP